jgi:hypothetical protein
VLVVGYSSTPYMHEQCFRFVTNGCSEVNSFIFQFIIKTSHIPTEDEHSNCVPKCFEYIPSITFNSQQTDYLDLALLD